LRMAGPTHGRFAPDKMSKTLAKTPAPLCDLRVREYSHALNKAQQRKLDCITVQALRIQGWLHVRVGSRTWERQRRAIIADFIRHEIDLDEIGLDEIEESGEDMDGVPYDDMPAMRAELARAEPRDEFEEWALYHDYDEGTRPGGGSQRRFNRLGMTVETSDPRPFGRA